MTVPAVESSPMPEPAPDLTRPGANGYGGFWRRVAATLVDSVIVGLATLLLDIVLGLDSVTEDGRPNVTAIVIQMLLPAVYEIWMTGSSRQATLGKIAWGLQVVDRNGARLSYLRSAGRYFAKLPSAFLLMIGFLMVAFTERKRGLHDMIAGTYVIKTAPQPLP